jgi:hypothetical protein
MSESMYANPKYERSPADIDILQYSYNLKRASKTDLHQDLLFYQMQLDSIERKLTSKLTVSDSSLRLVASRKITALNDEVERRSTEEFESI